jgi:hypothetical protein
MVNPNQKMNEKQTIQSILTLAREQGVEEKVKMLIDRYQKATKHAKTEEDRKALAAMGLVEIYKTIGCVGGLKVDGVVLIPPDPAYQDQIDKYKPLVRMD